MNIGGLWVFCSNLLYNDWHKGPYFHTCKWVCFFILFLSKVRMQQFGLDVCMGCCCFFFHQSVAVIVSLHRPNRALQELPLQTPTVQLPPLTLPKQHSQPTPSPLSLLPLPILLLLIPLAALWPNPQPQWPINLLPSPPRVQLVSWSTLMRIFHW